MKFSILFLIAGGFFLPKAFAQPAFSIATDISVLRSFTPQQHFLVFGQTVQGNMHFSKKESAYASLSYYTGGKFKNRGTALATDSTVSPLQVDYTVYSTLRYRQFSIGWKHYFKGSFDSENTWNLYGYVGYGLLFARITNLYSPVVDTVQYKAATYVLPGTANLKRLTLDIGLGTEIPISTSIFLYIEGKSWLPASDNTSAYLINNTKMPLTLSLNGGLRILID